MASTNHTPRLGLNQWEANDPVIREDFNADNAILDANVPRFTYGTYAGTGTSGNDNQTRITFPFPPKLVAIMGGSQSFLWVMGATSVNTLPNGSSSGNISVSCTGNTISLCGSSTAGTAGFQMNGSATQYFYFALG